MIFCKKKKEPEIIRTTKASEYSALQKIQPPEIVFGDNNDKLKFYVTYQGRLTLNRNSTGSVCLKPEEALQLATWIQETFS